MARQPCLEWRVLTPVAPLQLRARSGAQYPALDLLYPALAALSAFEAAALAAAGGLGPRWAVEQATLVRAVPGLFIVLHLLKFPALTCLVAAMHAGRS